MHAIVHPLSDLAESFSGHTLRGALGDIEPGAVHLLQLADPNRPFLQARAGDLHTARLDGRSLANSLRSGDIVFRTRGQANLAVLVEAIPDPTVALSPLVVIRVHDRERVDPGYLHWLLNSEALRDEINREARGTIVRMVGAASLRQLPIPLPPMERQRNVAALARLAQRENELTVQLGAQRTDFVNKVLWRATAQGTGWRR